MPSNTFLVSALLNRLSLKMRSAPTKEKEPRKRKENHNDEEEEWEEELIIFVDEEEEEDTPSEETHDCSLTHEISRSTSMHFLTPTTVQCIAANGDKVVISLEEFNALDSKNEDVYNEELDSVSLSDFSDDSDSPSTGEDITTFLKDYFDALKTK